MCPLFSTICGIRGDHAMFVISLDAEYAMTGSDRIRFFPSDGRGELRRELALRGEELGGSECGAMSHRSSWQSSAVEFR